eukprot:Rhum_TRINITY_DN3144_c0_g1::Rhum_TRINITY_DN3144_c0_g1_i1::g.9609::m.9609/K00597/MTRR; methionine synthase reductase
MRRLLLRGCPTGVVSQRRSMSAAPPPPSPPDESACCGSACQPCVWDAYYDELEAYNKAHGTVDVKVRTTSADAAAVDPFEPPQNCVRIATVDPDETTLATGTPYAGTPSALAKVAEYGVQRLAGGYVVTAKAADDDDGASAGSAKNLCVFVRNSDAVVDGVMRRLAYEDRFVQVLPNVFSAGVDAPTYPHWIPQDKAFRVRDLFAYYTDLTSRASARQATLHVLAEFAADAAEKAELRRLATAQGVAEYRALFRGPRRCGLIELLARYPSAQPPLGRLLTALPQLKARCFTNALHGAGAAVQFVVSEAEAGGHVADSVASGAAGDCLFLGGPLPTALRSAVECTEEQRLWGEVRQSLAEGEDVSLLLVSAGSGISPKLRCIRAADELRRSAEAAEAAAAAAVTRGTLSVWLYHGCREAASVPFREEIADKTDRFACALSRRRSASAPEGQYVQDLLRKHRSEVQGFLGSPHSRSYVRVCGPPAMMSSTEEALSDIVGADAYGAMQKGGGVFVERWGASS